MESKYGVQIMARTVRRRLAENNIHGRIACRKLNLSKKNIKKGLQFAKDHINKENDSLENLMYWEIMAYHIYNDQ